MKNIDKNSQRSKKSDDTLIYLFLFLLVAVLIGCGIWHFFGNPEKTIPVYDYEAELGKFDASPTAEVVSKLISGNRSRLKTVERVLNGSMRGRKLKANEKKEVEEELNNVDRGLDKIIQRIKLKEYEKDHPDILANIYSQLYDQGKILTRLKAKTAVSRPYEEVVKQWKEIQQNWEISSAEEEEIREKMNDWITGWYNQAMDNLWKDQQKKKLTEYIKPILVEGRNVKRNFSSADVNYFRRVFDLKVEGSNIIKTVDLRQPLQVKFMGYDGFLTLEDIKDTEEGKETFGITESTKVRKISTKIKEKGIEKKYDKVKIIGDNYRKIKIRLKKELFFNRLGYEEWINKAKKEGGFESRIYHDICFDEVVETIAHELAHAVIGSIKGNYKGQEGGGHGELFHDFQAKIEKMIRGTPEYSVFEKWWDKTNK